MDLAGSALIQSSAPAACCPPRTGRAFIEHWARAVAQHGSSVEQHLRALPHVRDGTDERFRFLQQREGEGKQGGPPNHDAVCYAQALLLHAHAADKGRAEAASS